jgi:hypothetical protein
MFVNAYGYTWIPAFAGMTMEERFLDEKNT